MAWHGPGFVVIGGLVEVVGSYDLLVVVAFGLPATILMSEHPQKVSCGPHPWQHLPVSLSHPQLLAQFQCHCKMHCSHVTPLGNLNRYLKRPAPPSILMRVPPSSNSNKCLRKQNVVTQGLSFSFLHCCQMKHEMKMKHTYQNSFDPCLCQCRCSHKS